MQPDGYCERLGMDEVARHRRLALMDLGEADRAVATAFQEVIVTPRVDALVQAFYDRLLRHPEAQAILAQGFRRDHLEVTQRGYLLGLGVEFWTRAYFEERLRIGLAHVWAGVGLSLYIGAYRILQDLLREALETAGRGDLLPFLLKITALDMSLAVEAYHGVQVAGLSESLAALRADRERIAGELERDPLTQVLNRRAILARLRARLERERERPFCLVMADMDHFKAVNDRYGHPVGDAVLRESVRRMRAALRGPDLVGRYGGEEFLILLDGATLDTALEVAERIRRHLEATPIHVDGHRIPMTVSQGVAQWLPGEPLEALVQRADRALYRAKQQGRNRTVWEEVT